MIIRVLNVYDAQNLLFCLLNFFLFKTIASLVTQRLLLHTLRQSINLIVKCLIINYRPKANSTGGIIILMASRLNWLFSLSLSHPCLHYLWWTWMLSRLVECVKETYLEGDEKEQKTDYFWHTALIKTINWNW